ncbi:unnamed protein product [Pieris brassicae]|uniref:Uncharacterized protein n=1 Tax=Pieris brassicae TaxID=7116 RepID=A0A9P0X4E0_PIEBR|nr:unnamed protein product [Pieris brassicae]
MLALCFQESVTVVVVDSDKLEAKERVYVEWVREIVCVNADATYCGNCYRHAARLCRAPDVCKTCGATLINRVRAHSVGVRKAGKWSENHRTSSAQCSA